MVSWGVALKKAVVYVAFLIMWGIIGSIIFAIGFLIGGFSLQSVDTPPIPGIPSIPVPTIANPLAFIVFTIVSYVVVILGITATFFKIIAEIVADEVERRLRTSST